MHLNFCSRIDRQRHTHRATGPMYVTAMPYSQEKCCFHTSVWSSFFEEKCCFQTSAWNSFFEKDVVSKLLFGTVFLKRSAVSKPLFGTVFLQRNAVSKPLLGAVFVQEKCCFNTSVWNSCFAEKCFVWTSAWGSFFFKINAVSTPLANATALLRHRTQLNKFFFTGNVAFKFQVISWSLVNTDHVIRSSTHFTMHKSQSHWIGFIQLSQCHCTTEAPYPTQQVLFHRKCRLQVSGHFMITCQHWSCHQIINTFHNAQVTVTLDWIY